MLTGDSPRGWPSWSVGGVPARGQAPPRRLLQIVVFSMLGVVRSPSPLLGSDGALSMVVTGPARRPCTRGWPRGRRCPPGRSPGPPKVQSGSAPGTRARGSLAAVSPALEAARLIGPELEAGRPVLARARGSVVDRRDRRHPCRSSTYTQPSGPHCRLGPSPMVASPSPPTV